MKEKSAFQMHFRLAQLRARLYQAMEEGDADQIMLISRQIDACQLALWHKDQNESKGII